MPGPAVPAAAAAAAQQREGCPLAAAPPEPRETARRGRQGAAPMYRAKTENTSAHNATQQNKTNMHSNIDNATN